MSWNGSRRRSQLPAYWPSLRRRILRRDPTCRIRGIGCLGPSTEVDHVIPGNNHSDKNLQGACQVCHARKSSQEGVQARRAVKRLRPTRHPGSA